jgi:hypothetical protein
MGTAILTGSAVVMGLSLGADTELWVPGLIAVFFGMGLGFCMQPLTLAMQVSVPPKDMGVGTSSAAFFRSMGGAVGTAVFISMLFSMAADKIASGMKAAMQNADYQAVLNDPAVAADPANAKLYEFFKQGATNDSLNDTSWLHTANATLTRPITEGFAQSIDIVMLTAAGLTGIAFLISFALPNKKLTDAKPAPAKEPLGAEAVPAH